MRADVNGRENSCLSGEAIAVGGRLTLPAVRWKKRHGLSQVVFCTHQHRNKPSDLQTYWSSISCPDGVYPTGLECAECLLMFWDVSRHFRSMSGVEIFVQKPQAQWTHVITTKGLVTEFEQQLQKGSPGVWFQLLWLTGSSIYDWRLPHHPWGRGWRGGWHPVEPPPLGGGDREGSRSHHAPCTEPKLCPPRHRATVSNSHKCTDLWASGDLKGPGGLKARGLHFLGPGGAQLSESEKLFHLRSSWVTGNRDRRVSDGGGWGADHLPLTWGFPGGSDGKESACSAGDPGSIPGWGRSPREGNGDPLWDSCLENPMDRGAWWTTIHGVAESDKT